MKIKNGFTLIELMMVVAIIGILSSVALPKFAYMVRKSREASTKGNLGAIRSGLSIYYAENEGNYPSTLTSFFSTTKYMSNIPTSWTYEFGFKNSVFEGI